MKKLASVISACCIVFTIAADDSFHYYRGGEESLTKDGSIAASSCHGTNMLVCAPGSNILSTMVNNTTAEMSGTSMACPHVSGVAALIPGRNPRFPAAKVREIIMPFRRGRASSWP